MTFSFTPHIGIWWSRAVLYNVGMTLASSLGHDDIQFYPLILASGGQEQYYITFHGIGFIFGS